MKKLDKFEVSNIFVSAGCEMLGEYVGYSIPIKYKCKCGSVGFISLDKFKQRLKREEGCWYCNRHKWTKEEDQILISLYGKESRSVILEKLPGISYQELKTRTETLKLKGDRVISLSKARKGKFRKYTYNLDFFENIKEEVSYWAGFIAATGCIGKDRVTIRLCEEDQYHLEKLQDAVLHTGLILKEISKNKPQVILGFYGACKWISDLENNYSIIAKKSLTPPVKLNENNALSYIVGYLDRTGYLSSKGESTGVKIQFVGTKEVLCWIKKWFDFLCPAMNKRYAEVRQRGKHFQYFVSGARAKYLIKKMLSIKLPRLERKWEEYLTK